ncbi:restriction endonuclease subunit S [Cucumibacter marinus]|uniref:restriction endonuclease subunit S n=1 Tax=Cucumibacter marinus TaxID=1121252 RepID=UPI000427407D|nr:restriction endonuclease subunit S [Cucumibacter marinus]
MNAERLLALYEKVAEAPDVVPRLRRFVLDLAVRGKLVPQEPGDEPASELLKRIAAEKARLVKAGEIRKPKALPTVDDQPFALPPNWQWVRIREVTSDRGQRVPDGDFTYIDVTAINKEAGVVAEPNVLTKDEAPSRARKVAARGDVLYSCVRPYLLNVAVLDQEFDPAPIASTAFAVLNGHDLVLPWYLWIALRSPFMIECVEENQRGQAYPAINDKDFALLPFPLPPLAEQRRIVAKVDELMALLDRLEAARTAREVTRDRLTVASLARLTEPEVGAADFPANARFALATLPAHTTRPDQIKPLRQTILNLAVRGKLVKQDPTDEPASELLERIAPQIEGQKGGRGRRAKPLPALDLADAPFELPDGWVWARFPELGKFGRGKSKHRPRNDPALYTDGTHLMIQTGDVARSGGRITTYTNKYNDVGLAQSMLWPKGTLCVTIAANIADSGILSFDACFPDSVVGFVPASVFENARYFEYFVRTAKANLLEFAPSTAQKNINLEILTSVLIPIPPLAEQHRIVTKVDALMALCDRLETALTTADTTRAHLLEALLHEALEPAASQREAAE